jgi:subtilase family serine protease
MGLIHLPVRAGAVAVLGLAITALTGAFASSAAVAAASSGVPRFVTLGGSLTPTTDHVTGAYSSSRMSVEVALAPRNPAALISMLRGLYTRDSGTYHHWLANGQFDARFAPAAAARAAVDRYLAAGGLRVQRASSPFLVLATGSSQRVSAAFRTVLSTYRDPRGVRYFSNSAAVQLPAALAPEVLGVVGLSDTVREHSMIARAAREAPGGQAERVIARLRDALRDARAIV